MPSQKTIAYNAIRHTLLRFSLFDYILNGSYGEDFCSLPYSAGRKKYDSVDYTGVTPYEICGPPCEADDAFTCVLTARTIEDITLDPRMTREERANLTRKVRLRGCHELSYIHDSNAANRHLPPCRTPAIFSLSIRLL